MYKYSCFDYCISLEMKGVFMILEVKGIKKSFDKKEILHGISFTVQSGKAMGFLGRNGAGKTTTFRCLMNVFKQTEGEFLLDGKPFDVNQNHIGYLPEERGMYAKVSLKDQLAYFAKLKGADTKKAAEEAEYWIDYFGLKDYTNKKLETLSKGNQQKIQIAQAFINDPDIIILDEPFSGLDPVNAQIFKDAIKEAVSKGKLVIFSSHQMAYVEEMCDEITLIDQGNIIISGDLEEIKRKEGEDKLVLRVNSEDSITVEDVLRNKFGLDFQKVNDEYLITKDAQHTSNEILQELLNHVHEIISFGQYRPSLQDIFVNKVGGETNA